MLSNVFTLSGVRAELASATKKTSTLPGLQSELATLRTDLATTRKESTEPTRCERHGIGPFLKDFKAAQS